MKPIAIFRHLAHEGAGYFAEVLEARHIPYQLIAIDAGDAIPACASAYSGLVFMGGNMSVNDDLPWIAPSLALIRDAMAQDIPVLGHCLGGQLMSKALGGSVVANVVKEIGWGKVLVSDNAIAQHWFGDVKQFQSFHWHGETFSLPQGATHLLSSEYCANQAYAQGKHFALQCHLEMTAEMIEVWCRQGEEELLASQNSPAVQTSAMIQKQALENLPSLHGVAQRIYDRWLQGVAQS
jgi:GMP synthase-like glutamine amidotransferase